MIMKKMISALLAGVMLTFSCVGVYAADNGSIEIKTAKYNKTTQKVDVSAKVTGTTGSQIITVMSTGASTDANADKEYDVNNIVYIDQKDDVNINSSGDYSFDFAFADGVNTENGRYFVRIGGSNIENPEYAAIVFENGEVTILYGDVTNNGVVDVDDAATLLAYVLNPNSEQAKTITEEGFANAQIKDKNGTEKNFTAEDVAMILRKAVGNGDYLFPVEK